MGFVTNQMIKYQASERCEWLYSKIAEGVRLHSSENIPMEPIEMTRTMYVMMIEQGSLPMPEDLVDLHDADFQTLFSSMVIGLVNNVAGYLEPDKVKLVIKSTGKFIGKMHDKNPDNFFSQKLKMHEDKTTIISCPNCGQKNRLTKQLSGGLYKCGRCKSTLENPSF